MSHPRQAIREAVVALLLNRTDAGDRVAKGRRIPWREKELPGILVTWRSEPVDTEAPLSSRHLQLLIAPVVAMTESAEVDDALDDLAKQIEDIIAASPTLSDTALHARLTNTEVAVDEQGKSIGALDMTFEVLYA